jgi:phosphatidylethanolamine/phosphatidyl-N-methylethanolamine N-methyltransferase
MSATYKGSIELLRDFWEKRSISFEKDCGFRQRGIVKLARETSKLIDGRLVLELGCGPGIVASFYPRSAHVVGMDFSALMLKRAKKSIRKLVLGDALSLPFSSDTFEVVTCFFMASDYFAKENILSEAFRVLETRGVLLYADYSPNDEHWALRREIGSALGESSDMYIEGAEELSEKLKRVGFSVYGVRQLRFNAEFRLERYVRSRTEIEKLEGVSLRLRERLKVCMGSGRIRREFILLISGK